jgi:hypothetical protein
MCRLRNVNIPLARVERPRGQSHGDSSGAVSVEKHGREHAGRLALELGDTTLTSLDYWIDSSSPTSASELTRAIRVNSAEHGRLVLNLKQQRIASTRRDPGKHVRGEILVRWSLPHDHVQPYV